MNSAGFRVWVCLSLLLGVGAGLGRAAEGRPAIALPAFLELRGFTNAPGAAVPDGYVGSASCRECHREEHGSWQRSYHRTMTQRMIPEAVLGKFDDVTVESGGYLYHLTRDGEGYFSEGPDPDLLMYWVQGKKQAPPLNLPRVRLPVVMATGSHHYQTYWVPSPRHPGILQTLPLVFLRETGQWIPREAAFLHGPEDPERFVTQWNHHCIVCHSTGGNPGLDMKSGQLRTQVAEMGISCEACHGPGRSHVELRRSLAAGVKPERDPIVNPASLDARLSSAVCGQCHGVFVNREESGFEFAQKGVLFRPGEELERTRHYPRFPKAGDPPAVWADLRKNPEFYRRRWWPDGQMLAGGREYTAQRESACHGGGQLSCLSCHSMHQSDPDDQLRRDRTPDAACVSCHREARYTTEVVSHTHHAAGSAGSSCVNCHMPHTSYALFKAIRNHHISVPRVAGVAAGGPPNACNLCHLDRPLEWTQEWLGKWYGRKPVALGEADRDVSALALWVLKGHAAQRVVAAWHFGWEPAKAAGGGDWMGPVLASALADDYGPVRYVAARSLRAQGSVSLSDYDFRASGEVLRRVSDSLLETLASKGSGRAGVPARLERVDGRGDVDRIRALLKQQDRRSVTVSE